MINDYKPETKSLLEALIAAGFSIVGGSNGGDETFRFRNMDEFLEELTAADDARIDVVNPDGVSGWIYLVLGNEPGYLVNDYTVIPGLTEVADAENEKWDGREQPVLADR